MPNHEASVERLGELTGLVGKSEGRTFVRAQDVMIVRSKFAEDTGDTQCPKSSAVEDRGATQPIALLLLSSQPVGGSGQGFYSHIRGLGCFVGSQRGVSVHVVGRSCWVLMCPPWEARCALRATQRNIGAMVPQLQWE